MKAYLNRIDGLDDAICTMFLSKRNLSRDREEAIRDEVKSCTKEGGIIALSEEMRDLMGKLVKIGSQHQTLLRFIDLSCSVYGMHRAGQDDIDSHAKRMDNRIIRSSTRLADFTGEEISQYYEWKILPYDTVLRVLDVDVPETLNLHGNAYVKTPGGYIREDLKDNRDVKRGLYHLAIPSDFLFRVNLAEFAHIYRMRNQNTTAHPEVRICVEMLADELERKSFGYFDRGFLLGLNA